MNNLKGVFLAMLVGFGMQVNAGENEASGVADTNKANYVMMRVEEGSEAIVGGNFDKYVLDISGMGFKKVFSVSLDDVEGYWGGTKELFVSRVGRDKVVINVIKKGGGRYLEAPVHMMNTKVKMTTIKYTVLGL